MIKAALILDNKSLTKWQRDALEASRDKLDICVILSCNNTRSKRNYANNFLYYILNYFTLVNHQTIKSEFCCGGIEVVEFDSIYDGVWQKIPHSVSEKLGALGVKVVIKFGMSLLRIDEHLEPYRILSFHHGDPAHFRGRPAGFYELLFNKSSIGVIVQELSNRLDAGRVWAICHSKIHHHSYKKTAEAFYSKSKYVLSKALVNLSNNKPIDISPDGKNYRLPSNMLVAKFFLTLLTRKVRRVFYGLFFEKNWNIATYNDCDVMRDNVLRIDKARPAILSRGYRFYADPFFSSNGKTIRLEALNSSNGLGEIIEVDAETLEGETVLLKGRHYSYPYSFLVDGREILVPEVASHSSPFFLENTLDSSVLKPFKGLENVRVVDGTLTFKDGLFYFFCGHNGSAEDCLYLFYSEGLDEDFVSHPLNPVVIDPARARMGGRIIFRDGKYFRVGQNNSFGYGDGIAFCEITKLSTTEYEEEIFGSLSFEGASGPHTLDVFKNKCVVDYYVDKFSLLAWYRRLMPIFFRQI
ncbi:glucosamine inositolphosphorylceramide transferase family protein [Chromobacterium violaceum]|uniref:glucosamine inositolphosphorylceramide transferase family protein n=1 Tax=Chromobacterium violaceum TaxID=536 RepID=UPI001B334CAD|nr:hypothetical protein [Chromobacterium violaceum]MBP4046241.1 hypothetical protein [Chromobacterium violaceum]